MILLVLFIIALIIGMPVESASGIVIIVYTLLLWVDATDEQNKRKNQEHRAGRNIENGRR